MAGPADDIENTPTRSKGRPKGTPKKTKGFRGTPKKISMNSLDNVVTNLNNSVIISNHVSHVNDNPNASTGLVNISNDCYFISAVRALFTLQSFRNHAKHFSYSIPWTVCVRRWGTMLTQ